MNDNEKKIIKNLISTIAVGILVLGVLIGSIFGLVNSYKENKDNADKSYNERAQIEVNVKPLTEDGNINDSANILMDNLDFVGEHQTNISVVGDEQLIITTPINSYNEKDSDRIFDPNLNPKYVKEMEQLALVLFFQGNIEFRTVDGQALFQIVNGKIRFVEPEIEDDTTTSSYEQQTKDIYDVSSAPELFTNATVEHANGNPYISLTPKDNLIDEFLLWTSWINSQANQNDASYVVWFEYEKLLNIVSAIDPTYTSDVGLFSYAVDQSTGEVKTWMRPFLITYNYVPTIEVYEDTVNLYGTFTEREAQYYVNKINNSNKYKYSITNITLLTNTHSSTILIVMFMLFVLLIAISIFTFTWYFGLLGLLAGIFTMLSNLFSVLILSSLGIVITGFALFSLFIIFIVVNLIVYFVLAKYKINNDKSTSKYNKFLKNYKTISLELFIPVLMFSSTLFVVGILLNTFLSSIFYLISLMVLIAYFMVLILFVPLIFILDCAVSFTTVESEEKWLWVFGYNNVENNREDENSKKSNKRKNKKFDSKSFNRKSNILFSVSILLVIVTMGISLTIFSFTGAPVNIVEDYQYKYNVTLVNSPIHETINLPSSDINYFVDQETWYFEAEENYDEVINVFKENGVNVKDSEIVRNEEYIYNPTSPDTPIELNADFGFTIFSNDKMSLEEMENINNSLATLDTSLSNSGGYELSASGSLVYSIDSKTMEPTGIEPISLINYSENTYAWQGVASIYILIIFAMFILIASFNWAIGLSSMISMLIESVLIISPLFLFFIPMNAFVWIPIILSLSLSAVLKTRISKKVSMLKDEDINWYKEASNSIIWINLFGAFMLFMEVILVFAYGLLTILPMALTTILSIIFISTIHKNSFPTFAEKLTIRRNNIVERKRNQDIENSKNKEIVSEEMIDGINI